MLRASGPLALSSADAATMSALQNPAQSASPASGATVPFNDNALDTTLWLSPTTNPIALLTITLPTNGNSRLGQQITVGTNRGVTALTIGGAGTIYNPPALLQAGDLYTFEKTASDTWALLL